MKALLLIAITWGVSNAAAASCDSLDDTTTRLACFDRMAQCAEVSNDQERLGCYEAGGLAVPMLSEDSVSVDAAVLDDAPVEPPDPALSSAPAPSAPAVPSAPVSPAPSTTETIADNEAFPLRGQATPVEPPKMDSSITHVRTNPQGIVYLDLSNGQVWKETTRTKFRYKPGLKVTITKGSMGANRLHAEGMKKYAKVVRVH